MTLILNNKALDVTVVTSEEQQQTTWENEHRDNVGFLSIFKEVEVVEYHATTCPLSIAFIDPSGLIQTIDDMPLDRHVQSIAPVRFALEVRQGWFRRFKIHPGVRAFIGLNDSDVDPLKLSTFKRPELRPELTDWLLEYAEKSSLE